LTTRSHEVLPASQQQPSHVDGLKQERARRTYAQILDAAAAVFAQKGFSRVTLLDIAEYAGVTKGAVYFHFDNKEAIAVEVSQQYYAAMRQLATDISVLGFSPLDEAVTLMLRMAAAIHDQHVFQAALRLHIEHFLIDGKLPTPFVSYISLLTKLLEDASAQGQLPPDAEPAGLARVLVSAFFGAQHISWVMNSRVDIVERIREVIDVCLPTASGRYDDPRHPAADADARG
jgi:AcrR family transcriptional regulator